MSTLTIHPTPEQTAALRATTTAADDLAHVITVGYFHVLRPGREDHFESDDLWVTVFDRGMVIADYTIDPSGLITVDYDEYDIVSNRFSDTTLLTPTSADDEDEPKYRAVTW